MKVSLDWLQTYFSTPLPPKEEVADALTFHVAEVEEVNGEYLDVKVLPDRAAYLLSHRGVALELSAALEKPLAQDPLRETLPEWPTTDELSISVEDPQKCLRYMGALVRGVKIGPSPEWLVRALAQVGQRSINNVVDATNYVMLNIGQPLHAFDANKLQKKETYGIAVRSAKAGEKITTLTDDEYSLPEGTLVIADAHAGAPIGIAGIKGGKAAEIDEHTTNLIIEAANFEGTSVRRTAQALKLFTDASLRFQNRPSPELAAYGMRDILKLIAETAGGEVIGVVDFYPKKQEPISLTVSLAEGNGRLGTNYTAEEVMSALKRLGIGCTQEGDTFTITLPFERRDILIPEDIAEEIGRILGYEKVESTPLPPAPAANLARYHGIERIKDFLAERGYSEISTQSFATKGEIYLENPLDQSKPALRTTLAENMREALTRGTALAPLVLGPEPMLKLFEIGTVFGTSGERTALCLGFQQLSGKKQDAVLGEIADALGTEFGLHTSITDAGIAEADLTAINLEELGKEYEPKKIALGAFREFSAYPFALRDVAVWTPEGTEESEVAVLIEREAGPLLTRIDLFDRFEKENRTSFAFRLVFQSMERTLSDGDLDPLMQKITETLNAQEGWEVR